MKKFLIVLLMVFVANLGCKKMDERDGLCACSPITEPPLSLVVKGADGTDFLNPTTNGYFSANDIKFYYLAAGGAEKQLSFVIRPSFSYGDEKFEYYQLHSWEILKLATTIDQNFYLKLGSHEPLQLNIEINKNKIEKLLVNQVEQVAETGTIINYLKNIYSITIP